MSNQSSPSHDQTSPLPTTSLEPGDVSHAAPVTRRLEALRRAGSELATVRSSSDILAGTIVRPAQPAITDRATAYASDITNAAMFLDQGSPRRRKLDLGE